MPNFQISGNTFMDASMDVLAMTEGVSLLTESRRRSAYMSSRSGEGAKMWGGCEGMSASTTTTAMHRERIEMMSCLRALLVEMSATHFG